MYNDNITECNKPNSFFEFFSNLNKVYHFSVGGDKLSFIPISPIWRGIFPANLKDSSNNEPSIS